MDSDCPCGNFKLFSQKQNKTKTNPSKKNRKEKTNTQPGYH
jgi:hypothetical protein